MSETKMKTFTWEELEKHNKKDDAYLGLYGKVYDVTEWKKTHPGGDYLLDWAAGTDITNLFESYHKLSSKNMLGTEKVPCVGELVTHKFPPYSVDTGFYTKLKQNVEKHFKENNITNVRDFSKFTLFNTIFIMGGLLISYYFSMYSNISFFQKMIFAILSGFFHHLSMVHLLHDASHSAYSKYPSVWRYFGILGHFLSGHSIYVWTHRHVFGHHIWTNVCGVDPDLGIYKASPHRPIMNYRERVVVIPTWFQPFMYMFITAQMKLDDIYSFMRGSMENVKMNDTGFIQNLIFWGSKIGYFTQRIFLPIYLGHGILSTLFLYSLAEGTSGTLFGYFSQITHISETCEWPIDRPIPRDWAEMQVLTATDYGHESFLWTYLSGYLNYQVPHHLFPSIAPHYYPEILPIIKQTCEEFKVKYYICDGFIDCVQQHWNHLKQFQKYRVRKDKIKSSASIVDKMELFFSNIFGGSK